MTHKYEDGNHIRFRLVLHKGKKNRTILAFHEQNFLTLKFRILFSSGIQKTFSAIFRNDFGVAGSQLYP